jgi:segregation and condensation protein B
MNQEKIKNIIEAALMVSDKPLSIARILELFEKDAEAMDRETIRSALDQLQEDYRDRGIELREVASGYRIQIRSDYAEWVNRLFDEKPPRYSRALLETLAIIAYRQPLTRAEIEDIRGVGVSTTIIKTLQEREWIKVVGHKDVPGRPELLATTKEFLDYFNLKKLSDLPSLAEIKELNKLNPDLFDSLENMEAAGNRERESREIENDESTEISEPLPDDFSSDDDKVIPITH